MIPIDRGAGRQALVAMVTAAERAKAENRPIVIFPQGTRVAPGATRTYKPGVAVLYQELKLPIIPLALNSGVFWPKTGAKRGGIVTFSFLPAIEPGLDGARGDAITRRAARSGDRQTGRPRPSTGPPSNTHSGRIPFVDTE